MSRFVLWNSQNPPLRQLVNIQTDQQLGSRIQNALYAQPRMVCMFEVGLAACAMQEVHEDSLEMRLLNSLLAVRSVV